MGANTNGDSSSLLRRPVREIAAGVAAGKVSAAGLAAAAVARAREEGGPDRLNVFLSIAPDSPADAIEIDRAVSSSDSVGPLAGVPIAVKDNICTAEFPTTCGSRILEGYRSPFEATAVRRLRAAGAVIVGKTNMDEFAMGSSTENSGYGPARNPLDLTRVPGGSSGGSAAAVAAGIVPAALGSETGGSVRQPAAFCGVVGIKPTYGRVSRYGLVAYASSLDHIGTLGRTVADAAALLQVISGPDPLDSTCADRPVPDFAAAMEQGLDGLVVGVPVEYFPPELDPGIAAACRAAIERMAAAGAEIREVSLPHTRFAIPTYYVIAPAEASSNLARYDGIRYGVRAPGADSALAVYEATREAGFGAEVKRRIMLGTYALSAGYYDQYYGRAQRVRALIARDFRQVFDRGVDVIFTPTTPTVAFRIGEKIDDPYQMYLADVFTVTANLAAIPGISIPVGTVDGLPVGGQFLADRWADDVMIRAAAGLERALGDQG
ncbi:MAG TPA: Asp-tRNA(Asn)/Glu-tRNA(Gln) amidotransferase subunit GatA [Longimicrobiales bacterium]|nr:Asp-tRNA(Asn)/Glu-tRNA(Gln) amidotransferase subunit GatA [Longimicrobiales bacterium]